MHPFPENSRQVMLLQALISVSEKAAKAIRKLCALFAKVGELDVISLIRLSLTVIRSAQLGYVSLYSEVIWEGLQGFWDIITVLYRR